MAHPNPEKAVDTTATATDQAVHTPIQPAFTTHPTLTRFTVPQSAYLATAALPAHSTSSSQPPIPIRHLATGAIVIIPPLSSFSPLPPTSSTGSTATPDPATTPPRVLLLRRAPTDSMPLRWEVPGGAVDDTDATVLHAAARELLEESGLRATAVGPLVGDPRGQTFLTRSGNVVAKFTFLVETPTTEEGQGREVQEVKLDPQEHVEWCWAREEEVRSGVVGGREVVFTTEAQRALLLEGFVLWRGLRDEVLKGITNGNANGRDS